MEYVWHSKGDVNLNDVDVAKDDGDDDDDYHDDAVDNDDDD